MACTYSSLESQPRNLQRYVQLLHLRTLHLQVVRTNLEFLKALLAVWGSAVPLKGGCRQERVDGAMLIAHPC